MKKSQITFRTLISLFLFSCFIILLGTGIVLYIAPMGKIANWTFWKFLGLTKKKWIELHIVAAFGFIIAAFMHLYYNWKIFLSYLRKKREILLILSILFVTVLGTLYLLPPFSYLIYVGEHFQKSWGKALKYGPPFGHAEQVSLKSFCKKMNIPLDMAIAELEQNNLKILNENETLESIAKRYQTTPMEIYKILKKLEIE